MKIYPDLFKGRREILQARKDQKDIAENKENDQIVENKKPILGNEKVKFTTAYMWNSSLKDDELGFQCLKALKDEQK